MTMNDADDAPFVADVARARRAAEAAGEAAAPPCWAEGAAYVLNPALHILPLAWQGLGPLAVPDEAGGEAPAPVAGEEVLLVWRSPWNGKVVARAAAPRDLLALKIVAEGIAPEAAAAAGTLSLAAIREVLAGAADSGLILAPRPLIRRAEGFPAGEVTDPSFFTSTWFTLQWHLTQACDLHCRHCYDRSDRAAVSREEALRVLDDLDAFCRARRVAGAVSFSGGNPLLHPHFLEIYAAAAERGLGLAILGNPAPRRRIEELLAVRAPRFFQVSLEGLPEHNDWVRGAGHFARTEAFLRELKGLGVRPWSCSPSPTATSSRCCRSRRGCAVSWTTSTSTGSRWSGRGRTCGCPPASATNAFSRSTSPRRSATRPSGSRTT